MKLFKKELTKPSIAQKPINTNIFDAQRILKAQNLICDTRNMYP